MQAAKVRDLALAKLKAVEKQKADVERVRDELRCALTLICTLGSCRCSASVFRHVIPVVVQAACVSEEIIVRFLALRRGLARSAM